MKTTDIKRFYRSNINTVKKCKDSYVNYNNINEYII